MNVHWKRVRRAIALATIGLVIVAGVFATAQASAASWTGTTHGKIVRSNNLVSGGTTWRGNFWFTTSRTGRVQGHAVIAYEPNVDVSGLNNAINYVKSVAGTALGLLGPFGSAVSGAGLGQIVGAGVSFQSPMAVRRGDLTGRLKGDQLTLEWDSELEGIPYDINFVLASGKERIGGGQAALRSPFIRFRPGELAGRRNAVFTNESSSTDDGVDEKLSTFWVAHREN